MKENLLKKKVKAYYENQGYIVWFPIKSKWGKEKDIFGIFDGIAWKQAEFIFFQMTTISNKIARREKIIDCLDKNRIQVNPPFTNIDIICWDDRKKMLRIFNLFYNEQYESSN